MAFEDVGQLGRRRDLVALWLGIQLGLAGGKDDVAAGRGQQLAITRQGARIGVEIFVWRELQAVDEDAGDDHAVRQRGAGLTHQGQVAVVQIAHGRHESARRVAQNGTKVANGVDDAHIFSQLGPELLTMTLKRSVPQNHQ